MIRRPDSTLSHRGYCRSSPLGIYQTSHNVRFCDLMIFGHAVTLFHVHGWNDASYLVTITGAIIALSHRCPSGARCPFMQWSPSGTDPITAIRFDYNIRLFLHVFGGSFFKNSIASSQRNLSWYPMPLCIATVAWFRLGKLSMPCRLREIPSIVFHHTRSLGWHLFHSNFAV